MIGTPLSILLSAVTARYLGSGDFGHLYVAFTMTVFAFQFVEFGHGSVLAGEIARDRSVSGELLGASLAWRVLATAAASVVLALVCLALGYSREFMQLLALVVLQCFIQALANACQDSIRGFERTDVGALGQVGTQLLNLGLTVPLLLLGKGIFGVLIAQAVSAAIIFLMVLRALRGVGVTPLRARWSTIRRLTLHGAPFLAFGLAMSLQPNVDAMFLSKLVPDEVVGWHAVARRLTGALALPGALIIGALFPTLSRLFAEEREAFENTARGVLNATVLIAVPIALCCALFPDLGIMIFSRTEYNSAKANLVAISPYVFLLYFSMPLGITLLAAGMQKKWAVVQFMCVGVTVLLDPVLIPWFQQSYGNGGIGVAVAATASEVLVVIVGVWLAPRGLFNRALLLAIGRTLVAGAAMVAVALVLSRLNHFFSAPMALTAYAAALWLVGGLSRTQVNLLRSALRRRTA